MLPPSRKDLLLTKKYNEILISNLQIGEKHQIVVYLLTWMMKQKEERGKSFIVAPHRLTWKKGRL